MNQLVRAAFDIGSGATKVSIARMKSLPSGELRICELLFEDQTEVLYGHDLHGAKCDASSSARALSDAILQRGRAAIAEYCALFPRFGVCEAAGIATAVFREASNGAEFLTSLHSAFSLDLRIVSQPEEALLGFQTADALSERHGAPTTQLVSWDSGGGSFQFTMFDPTEKQKEGSSFSSLSDFNDQYPSSSSSTIITTTTTTCSLDDPACHAMLCGALGSSTVTALLVSQVQQRPFLPHTSPNPVSLADALSLVQAIALRLPPRPPADSAFAALLSSGCVVGVGGGDCMFAIAAMAKSEGKDENEGKVKKEKKEKKEKKGSGIVEIQREDLLPAIERLCMLSDEALARFPQPSMVVPKLCLMLSVMTHFSIPSIQYCPANGSCLAILNASKFWKITD